MKHFTFLKSLLLLCALVVGSSSVWGQATVNTVLWAEDFSAYSNKTVPSGNVSNSHTGTTVYGSDNVNYACADGGTTTQVFYDTNGPHTDSNNSNLLISKGNGTFTVSGIPTGSATELTLSYEKNGSGIISVSTSTSGVTISGSTITTNGASTITLTFKNTHASKNLRIDDISLIVKTAGSSDPLDHITLSGTYPTSFYQSDTFSHEGMTVTATYGTGDGATTADVTNSATFTGYDMSTIGEQTVTVSYTEGTGEGAITKTATYNITVNAPPTPTSITLSGTYPTTFIVGDEFSHEGMTVTATYSDSNTDDVTADAVFSGYNMNLIGVQTVTVTYTYNSTSVSTTYNITVNAYLQPTSVDIALYNTFFNSTGTSNVNDTSLEGSQDNITVTINKNDGNKLYVNASTIRLYDKNTMVLTAPSNYVFTSIEFVEPSTEKSWSGSSNSSDPEGYDDSEKAWTGVSNTVTITFGGTCRMAGLNITLAPTVSIGANKEWITYTSKHDLDFAEAIDGLEGAYTITGHSNGATTLTATKMTGTVKAGTGLLLHAATVDTENAQVIVIPVAESGTEQTNNMLVGVTTATTVNPTEGTNTNLGLKNGSFVPYSAAGTLAAGKAYLQIPTADMPSNGAKLTIIFGGDGETTNINTLDSRLSSLDQKAPRYNMAGQRVSDSYKGIVIVNGKKYIRK